jgi:hypothetical protein
LQVLGPLGSCNTNSLVGHELNTLPKKLFLGTLLPCTPPSERGEDGHPHKHKIFLTKTKRPDQENLTHFLTPVTELLKQNKKSLDDTHEPPTPQTTQTKKIHYNKIQFYQL